MKTVAQQMEENRTKIHEVGHALVCTHYKINSNIKMFDIQECHRDAFGERMLGACELGPNRTAFQNSVIGFAGVMAEIIAGVAAFSVPFVLSKATLRDWYHRVACQELSTSDRSLIYGYKNPFRAFKSCWRILRRSRRKLIRMACLKANPEEPDSKDCLMSAPVPIPVDLQPMFTNPPAFLRPAVPVPAAFPASEDDFVRLACDGDGDSYSEFLTDRVKRQWRLTGAGADDAKAQIMAAIRQANPGRSDDTVAALFDEAFKQAVARERELFFKSSIQWQAEWPVGVFEYKTWLVNKSKA